ncbi:PcfJ domain-containing protein [Sulfuritalea sp.]|uniref:PcfJ domain-containing protein n=1 Tax=Sulfuritalea sp. TaxID=2480090 RepID=UPI001AD50CE7|nr:PcfJ domain-containing protein [Sulfuritalea sp.]MBN8475712.1 PcfJ domain-containing protein [Sulfuritalea sp.]
MERQIECGEIDPVTIWMDHPDPTVKRNRQQAAEAFPGIMKLVAQQSITPNSAAIETAIDAGKPLIELVASQFGIKKSTVRCLRNKVSTLAKFVWWNRFGEMCLMLDMLPPEHLPVRSTDWRIFEEMWFGSTHIGDWSTHRNPDLRYQPDPLYRRILAGLCSAGYEASDKFLQRELGRDKSRRWLAVRAYIRAVRQWCGSGGNYGEPNLFLKDIAETCLAPEFLERYSASELIRQAARWKKEVRRAIRLEIANTAPEDLRDWPALPGMPYSLGNLTAVSLTNPGELEIETQRLNHCVSSYVKNCMLGASHILSIRTGEGQSLSTAEISLRKNTKAHAILGVVQHRGYGNQPPLAGCREIIDFVIEKMRGSEQNQLLRILNFHAARHERIKLIFAVDDDEYPSELLNRVMQRVLRDSQCAFAWLDRRLQEEEAWYWHCNEKAAVEFREFGFDDELTDDRAMEHYRATGNERCFDLSLRYWKNYY